MTVGLLFVGRNKPFSVYKTLSNVNTSTDSSYRKVGMIATTVQELHYMIAGDDGDITFLRPPLWKSAAISSRIAATPST